MVEILLFERGWVTLNENFRGKGRPPPTIFGTRKVESLGYRMVTKIDEQFNRLSRVHQRHRQTTDGIANLVRARVRLRIILSYCYRRYSYRRGRQDNDTWCQKFACESWNMATINYRIPDPLRVTGSNVADAVVELSQSFQGALWRARSASL